MALTFGPTLPGRHRSLVSPTDVPPPRSFSLPEVQPNFLGIFLHSRTETDNTLQYNTTRHQIMDQIEACKYVLYINQYQYIIFSSLCFQELCTWQYDAESSASLVLMLTVHNSPNKRLPALSDVCTSHDLTQVQLYSNLHDDTYLVWLHN